MSVFPYGLFAAAGVGCMLIAMLLTAPKRSFSKGTVTVFGLLAIPLSLVFSRLLYCVFQLNLFCDTYENPWLMLCIWDGGYSIWGVIPALLLAAWLTDNSKKLNAKGFYKVMVYMPNIITATSIIAAWLTAKMQRCSFRSLWDCVSLSSALLFAMLYAGEGRTELGIGKVIDAGFLTSAFPFLVLEQKLGVNVEYRLIVYRLQCLACVVLFLVMLLSRRKSKAEGILALRFWSIFASMQIFWESLRDDGHMLFIFLRIGQVAAGIVLLWVLIDLSRCYRQAGLHMPWFVWPVFVLCLGLIAALEFSLDGRLTIGTPSMARDYGLMAAVCVILATLPCLLTGKLNQNESK